MGRWANEAVRKKREEIIIAKCLEGWRIRDIANHIGIPQGSVAGVIAKNKKLGVLNENSTH